MNGVVVVIGKLSPNRDATPGNHLIKIKCPYCPRTHTHGWRKGAKYAPQTRVAHCESEYGGPERDYKIIPDHNPEARQ